MEWIQYSLHFFNTSLSIRMFVFQNINMLTFSKLYPFCHNISTSAKTYKIPYPPIPESKEFHLKFLLKHTYIFTSKPLQPLIFLAFPLQQHDGLHMRGDWCFILHGKSMRKIQGGVKLEYDFTPWKFYLIPLFIILLK